MLCLRDSYIFIFKKACEFFFYFPIVPKQLDHKLKLDNKDYKDKKHNNKTIIIQLKVINFRFLVRYFPRTKGEPRARCTRWCLGHETFQFIASWETSDAEVEDGPLLWKLMAQR